MKKRVSIVITDLDDTLWNWLEIWYRPFRAMLDRLVEDSGVSRERLIKDFKEVHTAHGTSEYAFAISELPSLQEKHPGGDLASIYGAAIDAYRAERDKVLKLFPGVRGTLEAIRAKGTLIVGYTESMAFYTRYRLRKLGLDRVLDYLYSPADHELPEGKTREDIRRHSPDHYELRGTIHRHTPPGKQKPSAEVLLDIIRDLGADASQAIYVGDKLVKDVAMAQAAAVTDVHAAYGEAHERKEYELLRQVTHWTPAAVEEEKVTTADDVTPTHVLASSFVELLEVFEFAPFHREPLARVAHVVEAWKKTVEVQQHFNEIEMKIRNYAITVLVAVLGAVAFAVKEGLPALAGVFLCFGAVGVLLFFFMDLAWYHRLLMGAVRHGVKIEQDHANDLPELGLTTAIGRASPLKAGKYEIHSTQKLVGFYVGLVLAMVIGGGLVCCLVPGKDETPETTTQPAPPAAVGPGKESGQPASGRPHAAPGGVKATGQQSGNVNLGTPYYSSIVAFFGRPGLPGVSMRPRVVSSFLAKPLILNLGVRVIWGRGNLGGNLGTPYYFSIVAFFGRPGLPGVSMRPRVVSSFLTKPSSLSGRPVFSCRCIIDAKSFSSRLRKCSADVHTQPAIRHVICMMSPEFPSPTGASPRSPVPVGHVCCSPSSPAQGACAHRHGS